MQLRDNVTDDYHEYCTGGFNPDDVVISGCAGKFPCCDTVEEFKKAIHTKRDIQMPNDIRWIKGIYFNCASSAACINDIDKLDADFFRMNRSTVHTLDPNARMHLETSYEAIADSGYDPVELKRHIVAVYSSITDDDSIKIKFLNQEDLNLHASRCMVANRTSFALDLTGPSHSIDAACSTSSVALHCAYYDILHNLCDYAIVTGVQLNLNPETTFAYEYGGIASKAGNSIPFDATSDGMVRGEAIVALFLQRAKTARRAYARIVGSRYYSSGAVVEGISVPSKVMQVKLTKEVMKDAGLEPNDIQYIEAHGTGTHVGDRVELEAIAEALVRGCNRTDPLYISTVKSTIGHTESCSGICGAINAIFALESGMISPNRRYETPNPSSAELVSGQMIVPKDLTPLTKRYIPINSFGMGGTLVQIILKGNDKTYGEKKKLNVPRLVLYPATTEAGVQHVLDYVKENYDTLRHEFFALLNKLSFTPTNSKAIRGYSMLTDPENPVTQIKTLMPKKRPIWFVMTGMGCQWPGMGLQLMGIDVFAKSMRKSAAILQKVGVDLFELLRADRNHLQQNRQILPAFVTITSIQIAMIDLLTHLGIKPDGIVGHSTGEIACAYADGCCNHEETIMSAYYRGKAVAVLESELPAGGMAAVGLSWEKALEKCPKGIYPVCNNAGDSVTISGLKEPLEKFVEELQNEKIFARVVDAYGFGFHCEYVHAVAVPLRGYLEDMMKNPKPRSERWLSSSYPEEEWEKPEAQIANAEYFVHNLMNPVRFYEVVKKIPSDAITIEFGPHFLLQSLLKRAIGSEAAYIGLMKRNDPDNVQFFFDAMAKLYVEGADPRIEKLYPPVQFPVPRDTPSISSLIKWDHSVSYHVTKYAAREGPYKLRLNMDKQDGYLLDHFIDGRSLLPATAYIYFVWEAFSVRKLKPMEETPIVMENFRIHRATIISAESPPVLFCSIVMGTGYFEITDKKNLVATGYIFEAKNVTYLEEEPTYDCDPESSVSGRDLYNELKMNGYEYGPAFQGLLEVNMEGTNSLIMWNDRWIPFLDAMLLLFGILECTGEFVLPTGMLSLKLDPKPFFQYLEDHYAEKDGEDEENAENEPKKPSNPQNSIPVSCNRATRVVRAPGVEMQRLNVDPTSLRGKKDDPTSETYKWIPFSSHYTPNKEAQQQNSCYLGSCNKKIEEIGKVLGKNVSQAIIPVEEVDESVVEEFLGNLGEEHPLYNTLADISNEVTDIPTKKGEWLSTYLDSINMDIMNNIMLNEESLTILMGLVFENCFKKLSLLEINNNSPVLSAFLMENASKLTGSRFKQANLILTKQREVDEELLSKHSITMLTNEDLPGFSATDRQQDLVITSFTVGTKQELESAVDRLHSVVKPTGFILLFHKGEILPPEKFLFQLCGADVQVQSQAALEKVLQSRNLLVISKISGPFGESVYLIRPKAPEESDKIIGVSDDDFTWVEDIKKELYGKEGSQRVWLVSDQNPSSGIVGMVNCLKQEPKGERVRCVLIANSKTKLPAFSFDQPIYKELRDRNLVINVYNDGAWGTYRHITIKQDKAPKEVVHSYINCKKYGDLSSFQWIESPIKYVDLKDSIEVQIYYSALNFKDVMLATGRISEAQGKGMGDDGLGDCILGFEFSGRDTSGRRVCGFLRRGAMATSTIVNKGHILPVPDNWTLEQAATVPVVYATVIYGLLMRARLQKGESVLIHSGTGGIGLAAIHIATSLNCEIFVTVGTEEKREYLKKNFPHIKPENIGSSRDLLFEKMVMNRTDGRGVDVVLNSLAEKKLLASMRCVASGGRYVEIGKYDLVMDRQIGMKMFLDDIAFHGVFLDVVFGNKPEHLRKMKEIMTIMTDLVKKGVIQPLDTKVFEKDEVEHAFRYMGKGVHIGKVLLKIRDEEPKKVAIPKPMIQPAVPMTYFHRKKTYVIIGGLGGFGIEIAKWMVKRGARSIVLTSRYGARTPYHHLCLLRWKKEGVDVKVSTYNVGKKDEAEKLIREIARTSPVGGFFNSAVVLKDAFFESQTADAFKEVCECKAAATKNLDELSRKLCPELDYFVCFSSISCGRGNAGQTNYGYANSVMERVCEQRKRDGLHGLAIQWGIIGQVGVVHRHMGDDAKIAGVIAQTVKSCVTVLDNLMQQNDPVATSYTTSAERRIQKGDVLGQIARVLGLKDASEISTTRSFGEMGFDSMIGVEIKQMIESYCDVSLTMQEIQDMKIDDLKAMVAKVDSEKASGGASAMIATVHINLPVPLLHVDPLLVLNDAGEKRPLFVLNIGDEDIEGLRDLALSLNSPVYALLWTKDTPASDIQTAASYFHNVIRGVTSGPFNLAAYGISANIAVEMVIMSEKSDKKVKSLTLLYGSDDIVNGARKEDIKAKDADIEILCRFVEQFLPGGAPRLEEELKKNSNLDQRINTVINYITSSSSQAVNRSEVSTAILDFIKKRNLTQFYASEDKMSMDVNLFEDPSKVLTNDIAVIIEAFEQVSSGKVHVHRVCGFKEISGNEELKGVTEIMTSYL